MISYRKLSNGVRVVMEEMPQVNSAALGIWVKTGAVNETEEISGISHFTEHMMFKGTPTRDALHISSDIDKIGGQMNAMTGKEATCYYVKCTSSHLKESADVLTDMLENSLFDQTEMNRERNVICEEIKMGEDDPEDYCHEKLINGMFKHSRLGNSIEGTPETLQGIDHDVMAKYVHDQYVRDSIAISVAGKFDPDEVCSYFEGKFSNMDQSKEELENEKDILYVPEADSYVKDVKQAQLCLAVPAINLKDPRSYSFQILNNIMGGSMSSRMFQNIREQKGLAYAIYTGFSAAIDSGYFEISAGVSPNNVKGTIDGIREELDRLRDTSVSQEELDSSREQLKASYIYSQESTAARMHVNGRNFLLEGHAFNYDEVMDGFNSVTVESVDEAKSLICDFSRYSAAVVSGEDIDIKGMMAL
ncbi:MAG: pitrilysin family protein [Eubacteriales bacterium]|nr:pitrilysin family protein [Eubacteriales bacterium]